MAFGYGAGDVVAIGKLVWAVYKSCKGAPASFGNIAQEVIALEAVIRQFEEAFEGQALSAIEQERLKSVGQGCQDVLRKLQELVQKYESLGSNAKLSFDRFKWAAVPVDELRARLISNTTLLSTFVQTSPAVIMEQLRKVIQEYRNEKRESIFSSLSADSLTSDERTQWRVVRKELASNGLTLEVLDKHRELVIDCLSDVLGSVATQYRDTTATEEGKGKERVADLPPLINQDLTVNPFTNSAFDVSSERRKGADKDIGIEADIIIQFEARESEPTVTTLSNTGNVERRTQSSQRSFFSGNLRRFLPGSSQDSREGVQASRKINQVIEPEKGVLDRTQKILLLGAGDSGKSTLLKQMSSLFTGPCPIDLRRETREVIISNIIIACVSVIEEMAAESIKLETVESEEAAQAMARMKDVDPNDVFLLDCYSAIKVLEKDKGFQMTLQHGHEFALYDNITYYFSHLERIVRPDYIPSNQDILQSRLRTTGITAKRFSSDHTHSIWHVFDAGGCRSERKKWIHAMERVHAMVFVASVGGYNRCLVEDKASNAMLESLQLFQSLLESVRFKKSRIILLLTKANQLGDLLRQHSIWDLWPDYDGDPFSETDVIQYFEDKFLSLNVDKDRQIVVKAINLIDTESVHQFLTNEILTF